MSEQSQSQISQFLEECRSEVEQVEARHTEVGLVVEQTASEVERLTQRNAELRNRMQQIEDHFDTVDRGDIQDIYKAVEREQRRLLVMQGQMEKLQESQVNLDTQREWLNRAVQVLEAAESGPVSGRALSTVLSTGQSMVVRIIEAQESERQRLSRQIHDGPAQSLTNLILQAEICQRLFDIDPLRARDELDNLKAVVNKTFQETRTIIADLRPMMLDDLGLVPTLRRYVDTWGDKMGVEAEFQVVGISKEYRLERYTEVTLFRGIQELMDNAAKHANPSRVSVTLQLEDQMVRAIVADDGIGFDSERVLEEADARKTIGIATMMDRLRMLGGDLDFESAPGRGTRATLQVPET